MTEDISSTHGNAVGSELPKPHLPGHANRLLDHSSIQGMLKNSTETSDVGLFAFKPLRVPPSGLTASAWTLAANRAVHKACPPNGSRTSRQRHVNDISGTSKHMSKGRSCLAAGGAQHSSDADHFKSDRGFPINGYRSYSLTKSSHTTHSTMSRHPSGYYARSQGLSTMYDARPRSPFIYPTRLRRPGYRPSSPAISDFGKSIPGNAPNNRSHCTTTPNSTQKSNTNVSSGRKPNDQPESELQFDPSPGISDPSNSDTPKPALSLRSTASSSHLSYVRIVDDASWTNLHCSLSPPVFYDYTEAFEEHTHIRRLSISITQNIGARLCEDERQSVQETGDIPEVSIFAGLPSDAGVLQRRKGINKIECVPCISCAQKDHRGEPPLPHDEAFFEGAIASSNENLEEASPAGDFLSEVKLETVPYEVDLQQEGSRKCSPNNLEIEDGSSIEPEKASDSRTDSTYPAGSFPTKKDAEVTTTRSGTVDTIADNSRNLPGTPPILFSTRQPVIGLTSGTSPLPPHSADSELPSHEILAPTPERSIASLTARERLSKILSMNDDSSEVQRIVAKPTLSFRHASYKNVFTSGRSCIRHEVHHEIPSFAGSEYPDTEDDISEDEHELSKEFRETFCRPRRTNSKENMSGGVPPDSTQSEQILTMEKNAQSFELSDKLASSSIQVPYRKNSIINRPQQPCNERKASSSFSENRRASIGRNSGLLATPQDCQDITFVTTSNDSLKAGHPISFTPRTHCTNTDDPGVASQAPIIPNRTNEDSQSQVYGRVPRETGLNISRLSTSPPNSWPWNIEASYPWDDQTPDLDVFTPSLKRESACSDSERFPPFKFRIQRASSSTGESGERNMRGRASEDASSSIFESWIDRDKDLPLRRALLPDLLAHPGQSNSSHDIVRCRPVQTRFVESFQNPTRTSPIVTLLPPSPGHEVRSFFSDDSSQVQLKGSLRKRLSNFKTRQARSGSAGDHRGHDRGLLSSAFGISRASGRSSRQSQNTRDGASQHSQTGLLRWAMLNRVRSWFLRHEDRVREWRRKRQHKNDGPQESEPQPYAGV